ncbi:hypothetical protein H4696_000350 [Amycolatopsis lexingtonensis]|uniref:SRPBCC family protein n=1 Tax=Amycolatopsis lexingtonensis TaxID=218822 RepID=A0ABR9HQT7_9PSEU|nr:hypothetical protein [Amycolatopsis lexingtonensis]MBE1493250.1 hypothetical protein [Amycolatopsis lexingtonensis]
MIDLADPDFRVCRISFDLLLTIQREAEERGWATRWTSVGALRSQVKDGDLLLRSLMREHDGEGAVRAYRCQVLFSAVEDGKGGGVVTVDLDPERFGSLARLDRDSDVRQAFARVFSLAMDGIALVPKL